MTTPTITINTDGFCQRCGSRGATQSGYCLSCAGQIIIDKLKKERSRTMDENRNKTKEYLKCILTEPEIKESGAQLARTYSEITDLEDQKKSLVSDFKAKIDGATAAASILARKIQNGYEFRNIDCEEIWAWDEKVVQVVRLDTSEIFKSRPMTADELQKKLFVPAED